MKIQPGTIQELTVFDENDRVYLLGSENDLVALGKWEIDSKTPLIEGDKVKVFTFYNDKSELEATVELPRIEVGQVGLFKIKNVNQIGAFIDIGTRRDILIPFPQQRIELQAGKHALVILQDDKVNKRLFASTKIAHFLHNTTTPYERGDEVNLIIADKIDIGRRVIINGTHIGVLFKQEMISRVHEGETIKGYVRKIEGKDIQVSLQKEGLELLEDGKKRLMNYLELNNGYARLNDDSDPEEVKLRLRMSKKTFKKVVGMLYKEGKVLITKFGVKINKTGEIPTDPYPVKETTKATAGGKKTATERSYGQRTVSDSPQRRERESSGLRSERPARRSDDQRSERTPRQRDDQSRAPRSERPARRSDDQRSERTPRRREDQSRAPRSERPARRSDDQRSERAPSRREDQSRAPRSERPARRSDDQRSERAPRRREDQSRAPRSERPARRSDDQRSERASRQRDDQSRAPRQRREDSGSSPKKTLKFDKPASSKPRGNKRG